jgi:hypothetical protein
MKKQPTDTGEVVDPLILPDYTQEQMDADLEHDRMMHAAWGNRIPNVVTLPLAGSKCNVFVWSKTPRP